ncbi:hypothetical protein [Myxacorys almedinensis]|uniref:Uncharacterized protein n=1 Tax=Myxacorys almedinensis A TaxID=2690445 RepID=A0A8J7Z7Q9_9CYAN|nr:hypothetical protein [Myxacorys almedinensis]NDJ19466.1 hypothetical protein [Myxacorys almedinensis A]
MSPIKFGIQLPPRYDRKLRLWAKLKGAARATLAANIIQARIEANWADIDQELNGIAAEQGISRQELEAQMLNGGDEDDSL